MFETQYNANRPYPSKNVIASRQVHRDLDAINDYPTSPVSTALAFDIDACFTCKMHDPVTQCQ